MNSLSRNDNYLYTIKEDPTYYYTGWMAQKLQTLVVIYHPSLITIFFDEKGYLVEAAVKPLPESTKGLIAQRGFTDAFLKGADQEILASLRESGFREGPINVKRFFLSQYHIGIKDFPETFSDILTSPSLFSASDLSFAKEEADRWLDEGLYELWLNPESYRWINRDGDVEAS
jgi:hypothetical protein